jgi:hypothetical protein
MNISSAYPPFLTEIGRKWILKKLYFRQYLSFFDISKEFTF